MRLRTRAILFLAGLVAGMLFVASASPAEAGLFQGKHRHKQSAASVVQVQVQTAVHQVQTVTTTRTTTSDQYGFTAWLNGVRAQRGLPAVGFDPNLAAWANSNNAQQQARGIGHFILGPARRQNSAMGSYAAIGPMWMASPAHQAALLDPSIRMIGLAGLGAYWTYNAY